MSLGDRISDEVREHFEEEQNQWRATNTDRSIRDLHDANRSELPDGYFGDTKEEYIEALKELEHEEVARRNRKGFQKDTDSLGTNKVDRMFLKRMKAQEAAIEDWKRLNRTNVPNGFGRPKRKGVS